MTRKELDEILEKHRKWLAMEEGGEQANLTKANLTGTNLTRANLTRSNLTGANLKGSDLTGAKLDYSCWPLWCGSLGVIGDAKLVGQLFYHALNLAKTSGIDVGECDRIKELANSSTPVTKHHKEPI